MFCLCVPGRNASHITHHNCVCKTSKLLSSVFTFVYMQVRMRGLVNCQAAISRSTKRLYFIIARQCCNCVVCCCYIFKMSQTSRTLLCHCFLSIDGVFQFRDEAHLSFWNAHSVMCGPDVKSSRDWQLFTFVSINVSSFLWSLKQVTAVVNNSKVNVVLFTCKYSGL